MIIDFQEDTSKYGFVNNGLGTHSSRTMMLSELRLLLSSCSPESSADYYYQAIIEENVLLKQTESTRQKSYRHLRELYGLDPGIPIFHALLELWNQDPHAQPLLALLCAISRDPSFRATSNCILSSEVGSRVSSQELATAAEEHFPALNQSTIAKIGRNAGSSWTQSGHLKGRSNKTRTLVKCLPTSVAYALFLGYLTGIRGDALFDTLWTRLLDAPTHTLHNMASVASQHGYLEYRHTGGVTDITFRYLLRENDNEGDNE